MSDPAVTACLTGLLCSHGGRLERDRLGDLLGLPEEQIEQILQEEPLRFPQICQLVLAQSPLRICDRYLKNQEEEGNCPKLHVCRHYLRGQCPPYRRCKFSHDVKSDHNRAVLKANDLSGLNEDEIKVLLFQNDNQLLPEDCPKYVHSSCDKGEDCSRLHMCRFFTLGSCNRYNCKKSHNLLESKIMLNCAWLSQEIIQNFQMLCELTHIKRHQELLTNWADPREARGRGRGRGRGGGRGGRRPRHRRDGSQDTEGRSKESDGLQFPSKTTGGEDNGGCSRLRSFAVAEPSKVPATTLPALITTPIRASPKAETNPSINDSSNYSSTSNIKENLFVKSPSITEIPSPVEPSHAPSTPSETSVTASMGSSLNAATSTDIGSPKPLTGNITEDLSTKSSSIPYQKPIPDFGKSTSFQMPSPANVSLTSSSTSTTSSYSTSKNAYTTKPKPATSTVTTQSSFSSLSDPSSSSSTKAGTSSNGPYVSAEPMTNEISSGARKKIPSEENKTFNLPPSSSNSTAPQPTTNIPPRKAAGKTPEICLSNIWKFCKFGGRCTDMHYYLPYRWQLFSGTDWADLPNMEEIEKAYSDPKNDWHLSLNFKTMKMGTRQIRRLTTPSSVSRPAEYVLTTEWVWYWKDEFSTWTKYGQQNTKKVSSSILSSDLETSYLSNPNGTKMFSAGNQNYIINFLEMKQRNIHYQTEKEVCRRPTFLDFEKVKMLKGSTKSAAVSLTQRSSDSLLKMVTYPAQWDKDIMALPETGYKKVSVLENSNEFVSVAKMFSKTVSGHVVKKLWRVQNPSLWQIYQWQKNQMKKKNSDIDVKELQLFHGTDTANIDGICRENFDWRVCGTNGTVYGQGSYFARDASYSHNYSVPTSSGTRTMFVARVLVGDYTIGNPIMRRPPLKFSGTESYDSCVDKMPYPSIFVVFEKLQVYPEYVLEYEKEEKKSACVIS